MELLTRKEFSERCGVTPNYLSKYISRKKIILTKNKIDPDLTMNREFYEKRIIKSVETPKIREKIEADEKIKEAALTNYNLDKQIKEAELEKKNQEIEKLRLGNEKLKGESIPTDLVLMTLTQHFKDITTSFHQGADNFVITISKEVGLKRKEIASLRGKLIDIINEAIKDGVESSERDIKNIVEEYSQKRVVGERK